ncbi:MAG: hypothetical protein J6R91_00350 [Bacteroidaceae bacterium]|jgi:hypothetical protein|nr:hypothetical protein [Bacteroidaceae bacterium]
MKKFHYCVGGKSLIITFDEKAAKVKSITADGVPVEPTEEEMPYIAGVISLALLTYETEEVHDEETGIITVKTHETPWNSPARQMKNLINK